MEGSYNVLIKIAKRDWKKLLMKELQKTFGNEVRAAGQIRP
jgi:hypothetical protein